MKAQIKANIGRAMAVLENAPASRTDLATFKTEKHGCGTNYCAAGWLTTEPHFEALGMTLVEYPGFVGDEDTHRFILRKADSDDMDRFNFTWLDKIFGASAFDRLFLEYGDGAFDNEILGVKGSEDFHYDGKKTLSDKQLALARLTAQQLFLEAGLRKVEKAS